MSKLYRWTEIAADSPVELLQRRIVRGQKAMVARVELEPGCVVPEHSHENEQLACVLSGRIRFTLGAPDSAERREIDVVGGEVLHLPSNEPHGAVAIEKTVVLDVFSPPADRMGIDRR